MSEQFESCEEVKVLESLVGKTISNVSVSTTEEGSVYSVCFSLSSGEVVYLYPTNYNYGGQHLRVDVS